tara:strand:- start:1043 stop:1237 length:195 start_codon:yes stop_codon:yes gene_type:complete
MFVDKKTKLERLSICKKCTFYRNFLMFKRPVVNWGSRCAKCSCFLDAKTSLQPEWYGKCPENKW